MNLIRFSSNFSAKTGTFARAILTFKTIIVISVDSQKRCREFHSAERLIMKMVQKFLLLLRELWCAAFFQKVNFWGRKETKVRTNWWAQTENFIFWWFLAANGFM